MPLRNLQLSVYTVAQKAHHWNIQHRKIYTKKSREIQLSQYERCVVASWRVRLSSSCHCQSFSWFFCRCYFWYSSSFHERRYFVPHCMSLLAKAVEEFINAKRKQYVFQDSWQSIIEPTKKNRSRQGLLIIVMIIKFKKDKMLVNNWIKYYI